MSALENLLNEKPAGVDCKLCRFIHQLPIDDQKAVLTVLERPNISAVKISQALLLDYDFKVGDSTISYHRRKQHNFMESR